MDNRKKAKIYLIISIISGGICILSWVLWAYFIFQGMLFQYKNLSFIIFISFGIGGFIASLASNQYKKLHAGIVGEDETTDMLLSLPHTYKVLSNISIEHNGKKSEIDSLVISPRGICIIETKNYSGTLYGHEEDNEWIQKKTSRGGNIYEKSIRNPIKQAKRQAYILSGLLKDKLHIHCWIDTYVFLVSAESMISSSQVLTDKKDLLYEIQEVSGKENALNDNQIQKMIDYFYSQSE